jgi:hypothetical protein
MDPRLQEMLDHYEIRKTISEYCNGCDRVNEERMGSVYVEDSYDDHGDHKLAGPEFAKVMATQVATNSEVMWHLLGQTLINVTGDEAGAETYFLATSRTGDGGRTQNQLGGRFIDVLVRVGDGWKLKHRRVIREWTTTTPVDSDWVDAMALTPGTRAADDPCFEVLGIKHSGRPTLLPEGAEVRQPSR